MGAAIMFYLIYLVGVVVFAVAPAMRTRRWRDAVVLGGLFGFFCYSTYDLTNQATLSLWDVRITVLDLCWGTILTAAGASAGLLRFEACARRSRLTR